MLVKLDELDAIDLQNKSSFLSHKQKAELKQIKENYDYFCRLYYLFPNTLNRLRYDIAKNQYFNSLNPVSL